MNTLEVSSSQLEKSWRKIAAIQQHKKYPEFTIVTDMVKSFVKVVDDQIKLNKGRRRKLASKTGTLSGDIFKKYCRMVHLQNNFSKY